MQDFSLAQRSEIRERFLKLWNNLHTMYTELRAELEADGLAYEGQLFRLVAEGLASGTLSLPQGVEHVAIVGFNVINEVERTLFRSLQQAGMARFYWDYDIYYARTNGSCDNEAGVFMQRNLRDFPNALGPEQEVFSNFLKQRAERTIEFVEASTEAIQARRPRTLRPSARTPHGSGAVQRKPAATRASRHPLEHTPRECDQGFPPQPHRSLRPLRPALR